MNRGVENESAKDILRKHLSEGFKGPAWDALIEAVADGDEKNFELALAAYEQLFLSTASGKYLDQRGSSEGLDRPAGVGMSDEVYRKLVILATNNKLTINAVLDVLELYYGPEATRAYVQSTAAPFAVQDNQTLTATIDGIEYIVTFSAATTAQAVVNAINVSLHQQQSLAFADVYKDPEGSEYVRLYSAARGLKGAVQVTGGTAVLGFPTTRETLRQDFHTALVSHSTVKLPVTTRVVERTEETASYLASPLKIDITAATVTITADSRVHIRVEGVGVDVMTVGEFVWLDGLLAMDGTETNFWPGGLLNGQGKIIEAGTGYVVVDMGAAKAPAPESPEPPPEEPLVENGILFDTVYSETYIDGTAVAGGGDNLGGDYRYVYADSTEYAIDESVVFSGMTVDGVSEPNHAGYPASVANLPWLRLDPNWSGAEWYIGVSDVPGVLQFQTAGVRLTNSITDVPFISSVVRNGRTLTVTGRGFSKLGTYFNGTQTVPNIRFTYKTTGGAWVGTVVTESVTVTNDNTVSFTIGEDVPALVDVQTYRVVAHLNSALSNKPGMWEANGNTFRAGIYWKH